MTLRKIVFGLFLTAVLAGCSKDGGGAFMSAIIGGKNWEAVVRVTSLQGNNFLITGTSVNGEVLIITIYGKTPGTYPLASLGCSAVYKKSMNATTEDSYLSVGGSVTLSEVTDDVISGTFTFTMSRLSETLTIGSGKFGSLNYVSQ